VVCRGSVGPNYSLASNGINSAGSIGASVLVSCSTAVSEEIK
jgi:hypothetical protein